MSHCSSELGQLHMDGFVLKSGTRSLYVDVVFVYTSGFDAGLLQIICFICFV